MIDQNEQKTPTTESSTTAKTPAELEAYISTLSERGRELMAIWREMMKHSANSLRDNERIARACDNFFVASYWHDQKEYQTAIEYMEDAVRSLESVIQKGVTQNQHS